MALPTLEKTWQHTVNQSCTGGTTQAACADAMYKIKQALRGFGTLPWGCWGSCNGAGAFGNNDGVDRWASSANLVWNSAGNNHSWVVLTQTGLSAGASLCIDLGTASGQFNANFVLSPSAGFSSNGTATARPTATDEVVLLNAAPWGASNSGGGWSGKLHMLQSMDGQVTRVVICRSNGACGFWSFDLVKSPITPWSPAVAATVVGNAASAADAPTYANLNDANNYCFGRIGSLNGNFYMTSEGWGAATVGENITVLDDDTADYPLSPTYLVSSTFGSRGAVKGQLYDLWWGSTTPVNGDTYPGDGSMTFAHFGDLVLPWNGTTPLIA